MHLANKFVQIYVTYQTNTVLPRLKQLPTLSIMVNPPKLIRLLKRLTSRRHDNFSLSKSLHEVGFTNCYKCFAGSKRGGTESVRWGETGAAVE